MHEEMPPPASVYRRALPWLGGALLLYTVLFWRLGDATFWDPDEAHYAQTTRELMASGDWIVPTFNQEPFFDKPVFFHWLQSVPMRIVGPTEGAARFMGALALLLLVGVTWWVGAELASPSVGLLAALLLACNPGVFGLARYAILDAVFTLFLFAAMSLLAVSAIRDRRRLQYGGYVLLGFATCIKGPVAIALGGLAFAIAALTSPRARGLLLGLQWFRGLLIVIVIAAPWFVLMVLRVGDPFVDVYFLNENLRLFASPLYANQPAWWFYLSILATGFLPWTGLVMGRAYDHVRRLSTRQPLADAGDVMLWSWIAAVVGFFSVSQFKLDHYVFPAAPALCLVAAHAWYEGIARTECPGASGARIGIRFIGPTLVVAGVGLLAVSTIQFDLPRGFLLVPVTVIVCGAFATYCYRRPASLGMRMPILGMVALAVLYAGVVAFVMPALEQGKVVPSLARWVSARATADDRVATYRLNRWTSAYRFYVGRHVSILESDEDARTFFSDPSPYYCVLPEPSYDALRAAGLPIEAVYSRQGMWATSGRALRQRRGDPTVFVVATREP